MYYNWKRKLSINYLNGQTYIRNEHDSVYLYISTLRDDLRQLSNVHKYDTEFIYLTSVRGKSKNQIKEIKRILPGRNNKSIYDCDHETGDFPLSLIQTTDTNIEITTNTTIKEHNCIAFG